MSEPTGFRCECGKQHVYPVWVHAHWNIPISHSCDQCGRDHDITEGIATSRHPVVLTQAMHDTYRNACDNLRKRKAKP